jgi:hypothetical protein
VLAFSLDADEERSGEWNTLSYLARLVSAIIDGSQRLQLGQQKSVHIVRIPTGEIKATDFKKMSLTITEKLIENGRKATAAFFDQELQRVRPERSQASICRGREEVYTHVTDGLDISLNRVVIAEDNTDWVYSLFPSLLCWRMRDVRVQVLAPEHGDHARHGPYRRKLLRALGVELTELPGKSSVPIRAYVLDSNDMVQTKAMVGIERGLGVHDIEAIVYEGYLDHPAIKSILSQLDRYLQINPDVAIRPALVAGSQDQLLEALRRVGQYAKAGVALTIENVPLTNMVSLTGFVREYKYKQIHHLINMYHRHDLRLFSPASVDLKDGKKSILTPPVVEESGGKFILIEGSTRATYCRDFGSPGEINCVVARNVKDLLPSEIIPFQQVRIVGRTLDPEDRYKGFDYKYFRAIENSVHAPHSLD